MQQDILPSTRKIVQSSQFVSIRDGAIEKFCISFSPEKFTPTGLGDYSDAWSLDRSLSMVCLFNCVNFCFWAGKGESKWEVNIKGQKRDGAAGLFCSLEKAIEEGIPLLDARYLAEIDSDTLGNVLKGNIEIPLLEERVKNLREAGSVLLSRFGGSFMNIIESADNDAIKLTDIFIKNFSSFDDHVLLDGLKIEFHKRAQLNADMINFRLARKGEKELSNSDDLTAFADYKVPQMLRRLGILEYASGLAARIDSYVEIGQGTREEVEIRAATVWAIERMKELLQEKYPEVSARMIDDYLWTLGQAKSPEDKPYHRTKTICY